MKLILGMILVFVSACSHAEKTWHPLLVFSYDSSTEYFNEAPNHALRLSKIPGFRYELYAHAVDPTNRCDYYITSSQRDEMDGYIFISCGGNVLAIPDARWIYEMSEVVQERSKRISNAGLKLLLEDAANRCVSAFKITGCKNRIALRAKTPEYHESLVGVLAEKGLLPTANSK